MPLPKALPPWDVLDEWFYLEESTGELLWKKKPCKRIQAGASAGWVQKHGPVMRASVSVPGHGRFLRARVVWKLYYKSEPPGFVDHSDRDTLNDAPANLHDGSNGWNGRNRAPVSASGLQGVYPSSNKDGRWQVTLCVAGRTEYVGVFADPQEAHTAYLQAREKYRPPLPTKP